MKQTKSQQSFMVISSNVGSASNGFFAVMAAIIYPIGGCFLAILWGFLNNSQLILYFPLFLEMSFSANVLFFYGIYRPLCALDVLPTDDIFHGIFGFSTDLDSPYSVILEDMGYETHNSILNLGTFYMWIIVFKILLVMIFG